jgi:hypothetical protein
MHKTHVSADIALTDNQLRDKLKHFFAGFQATAQALINYPSVTTQQRGSDENEIHLKYGKPGGQRKSNRCHGLGLDRGGFAGGSPRNVTAVDILADIPDR